MNDNEDNDLYGMKYVGYFYKCIGLCFLSGELLLWFMALYTIQIETFPYIFKNIFLLILMHTIVGFLFIAVVRSLLLGYYRHSEISKYPSLLHIELKYYKLYIDD